MIRIFRFFIISVVLLLVGSLWIPRLQVMLSHYLPFAQGQARLIITLLVIGVSVIYFIKNVIAAWENKKAEQEREQEEEETELLSSLALSAVLTELKRDFRRICQLVRKKQRPWILLMGGSEAGKTTLLANSGLQLHSPLQQSLDKINSTQGIDWWISDDVVFIDPAGKYAFAKANNKLEQVYWQTLLKLLDRFQKKSPICALLLVVDFPTLGYTNNASFNEFIENFIQQIQTLKTLNKAFPVTLVITQCDRMVGFNEFVDILNPLEKDQPFGFHLMVDKAHVAEQLESKFDSFIKHLNRYLLWRLHHEQSLHKRDLIKEFPLQVEKLGQRLETFINQLPWSQQIFLQGVYFVSSIQKAAPVDLLLTLPINQTFGIGNYSHVYYYNEEKPFFIKQLMTQVIHSAEEQLNKQSQITKKHFAVYPAAILLLAGLTFLWHQSYQKNLQVLQQMNGDLALPLVPLVSTVEAPWLTDLNRFYKTSQNLLQANPNHYRWLGFGQTSQLYNHTQQVYHGLLQAKLAPYLEQVLATQIEKNEHSSSVALYNALKAYLMFSQPKHFDPIYIKQWFQEYWENEYKNLPAMQHQLNMYLDELLKQPQINWPVNELMIEQVQEELKELPLAQIAFIQLQDGYPLQAVPVLMGLNQISGIDLEHVMISIFYTPGYFQKIYKEEIPQIGKVVQQGNWVIGLEKGKSLSAAEESTLVAQVQSKYLHYYAQQWIKILPQIQLIMPNNLAEAEQAILLVTDKNSQLWKLLRIIRDNINLSQGAGNHKLLLKKGQQDANFEVLQKLLRTHQTKYYQKIKSSLGPLYNYLHGIREIDETDKASYQAAVQRMQNTDTVDDPIAGVLTQASQAPPLLQNWLTTIAKGSWRAILNDTQQYLNTIWTTTVLPEYQQYIQNRYPIFADAPQQMSWQNFTNFFGPKGTIDTFFNQYLKSFVNMDTNYWTWKDLDGETLSVSQQLLEMMIRASMIQQMFFTDHYNQAFVQFSLMPLKLSSNVNSITLNVGNQLIQSSRGKPMATPMQWPINNAYFVTVLFDGKDGKSPNLKIDGPWAWFKLLDQAKILNTKNPREYEVIFKIDDYMASYLLVADHLVNPYIPGVLTKFRCPEKL